ncbi:MAG: hypothetical protein J6S56_03310 [Bacteroidales bacterium]|nr:hypothetical protein [Bacteroidales bacterium]
MLQEIFKNYCISSNDSHCSLLCIRKQNSPQALCQELYLSAWNTVWSGSLSIGGCWNISNVDKYYVGDFNGDGYDELLCTQVTNGNTDWMSLLHYGSSWSTLWCNNGISEGVGIYPYRNHLNIGNFDPDDADEILGTSTWATKFDLNSSNNWDWSWSTYESRYLSDWYVRPNDRVFFFKTMPFVPDYLFVVSSYLGFSLNGYSFNPN